MSVPHRLVSGRQEVVGKTIEDRKVMKRVTSGSEKLKLKNDSHEGQKVCKSRRIYGIVGYKRRDKLYMAFEAARNASINGLTSMV
jgi:hypothetical protein